MAPKHFELARADLGTWEWRDGHNPKVLQYFKDVGHGWVQDDETAWCAAFVGAMLKRAGLPHTGKLNARSYLQWGEPVALEDARPGDVVVFSRGNPSGWQGHVAFFVSAVGDNITVLGGNQGNQVSEQVYPRARLLGIRRWQKTFAEPMESLPEPVRDLVEKADKSQAKSTTNWAAIASAGTGGMTALAALDWKVAVPVVLILGALAFYIIRERGVKSRMARDVKKVMG